MAVEGFKIVKVKYSEPEAFLILDNDSKLPNRACDSLTERELRSELSKMGLPESERDFLIQRARENPK